MDKKAISTVVATILIVLLAVVAVVIVWAVLRPALEKAAGGVSTTCLEVDSEIASATCGKTVGSTSDVSVKLNSGKVYALKLVFSNGTESQVVDRMDIPVELETKAYRGVSMSIANVNSVNVGAVIKTEAGENKTCQPTATARVC